MYKTNTAKMPTFLAHYCNKAKLHVPQLLFYYQTFAAAMQTITIKMMGKGNFYKAHFRTNAGKKTPSA